MNNENARAISIFVFTALTSCLFPGCNGTQDAQTVVSVRKQTKNFQAAGGGSEIIDTKLKSVDEIQFPSALRGFWDLNPQGCSVSNEVGSDTMFEIRVNSLHGYENNDDLKSIAQISASPLTWRVITISDIAPRDIQGDADIYVLLDGKLTIRDGSTSETYTRCER